MQVLPKSAALRFIRVNMLVKRLMADRQLEGDLLGIPLQTQQSTGFFTKPRLNSWGVATTLYSLYRELTGFLRARAPRTSGVIQFTSHGGPVPIQQLGYLSSIVTCFNDSVNLISFSLAEVFVLPKQLRLAGQGPLNHIHHQTPIHQLIKVALRA
jgi:hypothetical protein